MTYKQVGDRVMLSEFDSFDIQDTLECGQCFRFVRLEDKHYIIAAFSKVLHIAQKEDTMEFYPCTAEEFENMWMDYFDLHRDYEEIKDFLAKDPILKEAIAYAGGIRILNQDVWECLISFIISQNNHIPRIKQIIRTISDRYGDRLDDFYSFPKPEQFQGVTVAEFMACKTGFRGKYIFDAVEKVTSGTIKIGDFQHKPTAEIKKVLMSIMGVGPKVSDCVMLFSCRRHETFPIDVWIQRVMQQLYFGGKAVSIKEIHDLADKQFGKYAGFAQQYLFHYARQMKIGAK